jgi:hypothetical protein
MSSDHQADEWPVATLALEFCVQRGKDGGWDQPPALAVVIADHHILGMASLPIPDAVWDLNDPIRVINGIEPGGSLGGGSLGGGVHWQGFALCAEAWVFDCECGRYCEHRRWVDAGKSIADHPDGHEARMVCAVTIDDRFVMVYQIRGGKPRVEEATERGKTLKSSDSAINYAGRVPDALWALIDRTQRNLAAPNN